MIKKDNDKLNLYSLMVFNEGAYLYKKGQNEIQEKDGSSEECVVFLMHC